MNDRKEYNLIDKNGNLVTQWFSAIKPLQQPYGKYKIIAYINVGGWGCALGFDGSVYPFKRSWLEMYTENREILTTELFMNMITEQIDNTMKTNKKVIRLTESDLYRLIEEAVRGTLNEGFGYNLKEPYFKLINAIDEFMDILQREYDIEDNEIKNLINSLDMAKECVDEFVRHPEGINNSKIWEWEL